MSTLQTERKMSQQRHLRLKDRLRSFAGSLFRSQVRRQVRRFLKGAADCQATQREVLRRLLALNDTSRFSQEHGLTASLPPAEFRSRIPISDYERYRPYIERLKIGDTAALLGPQNKLIMFALTSGTTSDSKFIPITQRFLDDYRRGWQIWGIHAYDARPGLNSKNILQVTSDYNRYRTPGGTPCGNISGLAVASQRPIVRFMYTIPHAVSKIDDALAKYYTILRLGLCDDNIGVVMTANPSTLLQLATLADAEKETLLRDIADGTLSPRFNVSGEVRQMLAKRVSRRRPQRARELEMTVHKTGSLRLDEAWPRLEQLAIWTAGSCAAYLSAVRQHFGQQISIRDHGLSASEGRMTIPLHDERSDGVLDVMTHYFEFIPEAEHGQPNPTVLEAHELIPDHDYFILLTTSSGLYRYDICDVAKCTGFVGTTPVLRFLHKGAHISNLTGEKISESQVVDAVRAALETQGRRVTYFTLTPVWGEPPYYQLLIEDRELPTPDLGNRLAAATDAKLQEVNCEYHEKRTTGRLAALRVVRVCDGTWRQFAEQYQLRLGGSIEQYKHPCLIPDLETVAHSFSGRLLP
ncbi:MAG TPA: GH3 auxin-responsive promoter family protein [Planctomycetaceae bacterium]|nr:GH3 auxin-responsive promoter family protein [Planctomycetaceae bacterium]